MDYFDDNADCSVNEFYEQIEKLRKNLKKQGKLTPEVLEEKKHYYWGYNLLLRCILRNKRKTLNGILM